MNIVQAGKTAVNYLRHASPVISAGVAVVGVIALFVLTAKDTQKAKDEVFDELKEREEPLTNSEKKDVAIKLVKIYSRSLICIIFTITSIVFSTCTFNKRLKDQAMYINSLAAYAAASHAKLREYEETYGIEKKYTSLPPKEAHPVNVELGEEEEVLCAMDGFDSYFTVPDEDHIHAALERASYHLKRGWNVSLGEFFTWLNAVIYDSHGNKTDLGIAYNIDFGWSPSYVNEIYDGDFGEFDNEPIEETDDSGLRLMVLDIPAPTVIRPGGF